MKKIIPFKNFILLLIFSIFTLEAQALTIDDGIVDIWPTIPFIRGSDLCRYSDAYGQSRTQYMNQMVQLSTSLMKNGAKGPEALSMLLNFNNLYDRNLQMATQYKYLDVTLESTFKAYLDQFYRDLKPKIKKIRFKNVNDLLSIINSSSNGLREGTLTTKMLEELDYIAYGTYAFAPNCDGTIQVTLQLIGKNGVTESFLALGKPQFVMSKIASDLFSKYQRTIFPSTINMGNKKLKLIGGLNGSVDRVSNPELAESICSNLGGRLPTPSELEFLNAMGDWSGGVSLKNKFWALSNGLVFCPTLRNPSPVRTPREVTTDEFLYYCVQ